MCSAARESGENPERLRATNDPCSGEHGHETLGHTCSPARQSRDFPGMVVDAPEPQPEVRIERVEGTSGNHRANVRPVFPIRHQSSADGILPHVLAGLGEPIACAFTFTQDVIVRAILELCRVQMRCD